MAHLKQLFLMASDLETTRAFYEAALGLDPTDIGASSVAYETGDCELKIQSDFPSEVLQQFNLSQPPESDRGAGAVYVVGVDGSLDSRYERMRSALDDSAGELLIEPQEVPWGGRMFLVRDPDGYVLEIRANEE